MIFGLSQPESFHTDDLITKNLANFAIAE